MSELTWEIAHKIVGLAVSAGDGLDRRIGVVVIDASGTQLAAARHHDAYPSAPTIAGKKAFTALNFRTPTHAMAERLGSIDYALQISLADPRLAIIKGGLPLYADDRLVGAIGVSGGSADEDLQIATTATADSGFRIG